MRPRWVVIVTLVFGAALLTVTALQAQSVMQSLKVGGALVDDLRRSQHDQRLLLLCEMLQLPGAQGGNGTTAGQPLDADADAVIRLGNAAGIDPAAVAEVAAALQGAGLPSLALLQLSLEQRSEQAAIRRSELLRDRAYWGNRSYRMLLVEGNLVMVLVVAAVVVAALYVSSQAGMNRSVHSARRTVLAMERRRASFVAAAGHDLHQPLQAVRLFLATLLQRPLDPESHKLARKIESAMDSMQRMIGGLLDVAKLDAGLVAADRQDIAVSELLESFRDEFERLAWAAGLGFSVPTTKAVIHTDPVLLESILRNLLSNAIRYTMRGGIWMKVEQSGAAVMIAVHDTGPGIAHDKIETMFNDFVRVGTGPSNGIGVGLGLGLGIVRRLSALLQISVVVESVVGGGSVFRLTIPAGNQVRRDDPVRADMPAHQPGRMTALLVEDNDAVREALTGQLDCWDIEVVQAASGRQARTVMQGRLAPTIDMVIADYDLGDSTGLAVLDEIAQALGQRPCGLIITGTPDEDNLTLLRRSPYPWLRKPLDPAQLHEEINRLKAKVADRAQLAKVIQSL